MFCLEYTPNERRSFLGRDQGRFRLFLTSILQKLYLSWSFEEAAASSAQELFAVAGSKGTSPLTYLGSQHVQLL